MAGRRGETPLYSKRALKLVVSTFAICAEKNSVQPWWLKCCCLLLLFLVGQDPMPEIRWLYDIVIDQDPF